MGAVRRPARTEAQAVSPRRRASASLQPPSRARLPTGNVGGDPNRLELAVLSPSPSRGNDSHRAAQSGAVPTIAQRPGLRVGSPSPLVIHMNTPHSRHSDAPGIFGCGEGKRWDPGAASAAIGSDPALATVGEVHRAEVGGR